jgi:hypothetical protein
VAWKLTLNLSAPAAADVNSKLAGAFCDAFFGGLSAPFFLLHNSRTIRAVGATTSRKGTHVMLKHSILAAIVVTLTLTLTACGSSTKTTVTNSETQGQQLIDLKEAYDKGVITEKEYERAKEDILDQ